ncbi:hypothetical protein XENTR_v10013513 [Xenopus tropicalis]|nr:hypothetical protein XENTR_v10013513 [Xenopus tropicalis]
MAAARKFFRLLLKPFTLLCNIKCRRKKSNNDNSTSCSEENKDSKVFKKPNKLESEETLQICINNDEPNKALSTCVTDEERNEVSVPCKAEQEGSKDFSACVTVEQVSDLSTLCLKEEYAEKAANVECEENQNDTSCKTEQETSNDATLCKNEQENKPEQEEPNPCSNEEQRNEATTSCLKEKKTRKVARKGKRNKKQIPKVEIKENPSNLCLKEQNSKKMARKERKNKKRLIKAEIVKNTPTDYEGLYRPLYDCIYKGERNETSTYKTEPDYTPSINEKIMPFTDCLHERRAKKEERKGRKYNRQTIKAEENKKREKSIHEFKSHTRPNADEEYELSDDSSERVEVTGQPFPIGTDDWIPELNLTQQHKNDLRGRECLDDRIIDAAQSLLKIQFGAEGLQSCLLSQIGFNPVKGPSVQIHYDSVEKHWLTSCFAMDHVEIANSAKTKHHCTSLRKQIKDCYSALVNDPEGTMEILEVDEQENNYDCGVYAIANAFAFLSGGNPICKYDCKKMRGHLIRCLERRKFTAFPKKADACVVDLEPTLNFTWLE